MFAVVLNPLIPTPTPLKDATQETADNGTRLIAPGSPLIHGSSRSRSRSRSRGRRPDSSSGTQDSDVTSQNTATTSCTSLSSQGASTPISPSHSSTKPPPARRVTPLPISEDYFSLNPASAAGNMPSMREVRGEPRRVASAPAASNPASSPHRPQPIASTSTVTEPHVAFDPSPPPPPHPPRRASSSLSICERARTRSRSPSPHQHHFKIPHFKRSWIGRKKPVRSESCPDPSVLHPVILEPVPEPQIQPPKTLRPSSSTGIKQLCRAKTEDERTLRKSTSTPEGGCKSFDMYSFDS